MTSCPAPGRLAAAVSGDDLDVIAHAADCARCATTIEEHGELIAMAREIKVAPLPERSRRAMAAEVMAISDLAPAPAQRLPVMIAVGTLVAAAVVLLVLERVGIAPGAPTIDLAVASESVTVDELATAQVEPTPGDVLRPAELFARDADFERRQSDSSDVVTLRDGELAIDARDREPVTVVAGDTRVRIAASRATVVARNGAIVTTHVFAGTAKVTEHGRVHIVESGDLWTARAPTGDAKVVTSAAASLEAFREGWDALHSARYADAIAAFDRANDPVVAEDAMFWAAIASERAADWPEARRRLQAFVDKFPASPRLAAAQAALARVDE